MKNKTFAPLLLVLSTAIVAALKTEKEERTLLPKVRELPLTELAPLSLYALLYTIELVRFFAGLVKLGEFNPGEPFKFYHAGLHRSYFLYEPENIQADAPVVFWLHGYTDTASTVQGTGLIELADRHGFAVVSPQGTKERHGLTHWNANLLLSEDEPDDAGFLIALLQNLQAARGYSPEKSFLCGMSNGGFMTYHMAVNHPDVFKAYGPVVSTHSKVDWDNRFKARPANIISIVGLKDTIIPFNGLPSGPWSGAPEYNTVIAFWVDLDQATLSNRVTVRKGLEIVRYQGEKQFWDYRDASQGHLMLGSGIEYYFIWEFFSQFV